MSGIAGIIQFDGQPARRDLIEKMTRAMAHRGPDGVHHFVRGSVAVGHCMLATTPENLVEKQPHSSEDEDLVLVMDGRVDNRNELRSELRARSVTLRFRTDAELVLRAYETWGEKCLSRIEGDFAIAIWDERKRQLFCARDRTGNRPFYYWRTADHYIFATDLHALLALPGLPRTINEGMVAEHLAVRVDNTRETLYANVSRLPAAHAQTITANRCEEKRYWDVDCEYRLRYKNEGEYVDHFSDIFLQCVNRQMRSCGPVGSYLSGGLDSSSIFTLADMAYGPERTPDIFSLNFPGLQCDETRYIEAVCTARGRPARYYDGSGEPFDYHVEQVATYQDVCDAPNGAMLNPLRRAASEMGIKVMLTGYGGDELFGRNPFYWHYLISTADLTQFVSQLRHEFQAGISPSGLWNDIYYFGLAPFVPDRVRAKIRRARGRSTPSRGIVSDDLRMKVSLDERILCARRCHGSFDKSHNFMHNFLQTGWGARGAEINNREVAAFGLEERNPFLDVRMIEFAFSLPETLRSRQNGKHIVRAAMEGALPEQVRLRRSKTDFSPIMARTLASPEVMELLQCQSMRAHGWIDADEVRRRYVAFLHYYREGDARYVVEIWPLWMAAVVELWTRSLATD